MKQLFALVLSLFAVATISNAQVCTLKSNALTLGTGSVQLAAEFSVAPQWTVELAGMATLFSPWKNVGNGLYLNGWSAVAEGRYYLCKAFNGHHFGAFGQIARYGKGGGLPIIVESVHDNVKVAALGVSYGYYFKLNTYWGIDTNIGIGGGLGDTESMGWKFIPTGRAEVSVCYKF